MPETEYGNDVRASSGRVFVINLVRAVERRTFIQKELGRAGFFPSDIEFLRAVDARELTPDRVERRGASLFANWRLPGSAVSYHARDLKWGEVACSLSHIEVWRQIAASAEPFALVLEDDVEFLRGARAILRELWLLTRLAPDWHLCYVGRRRAGPPFCSLEQPETKVAPNLVVPTFSYGAYAYAVSRAGAVQLLEARLERAIVPVDEFLPALYAPHPRQDVRDVFGCGDRLRAFALTPKLARQPGIFSSTVETSDAVVD
jgi:glycosyl transferase family 25